MKSEEKDEEKRDQSPPLAEWIMAAIGFILVSGAIGFMLYQSITHTKQPPNFIFKVGSTISNETGYLVEFELENTGNETASAVMIEGELTKNAESVEKSSATLVYAPSHSRRHGGLFFTKNPKDFELKIRVVGYERP